MKIIDFVSQYVVVARTGPYVGSSKLDPYYIFNSLDTRYKMKVLLL